MEEESGFAGFRNNEIEANYLDNHGLRLCISSGDPDYCRPSGSCHLSGESTNTSSW